MADSPNNLEKKEAPQVQPQKEQLQQQSSPKELSDSREVISSTLESGEGGEQVSEFSEGSERVSETASEGKEQKGDGVKTSQKSDDGQQGDDDDDATFTFDEGNLPPVPDMIKKIEKQLRTDIRKLEKEARKYSGGLFRKPNYTKYSETMIEIRKKTVLLKRLVGMASDALKKLFLQMFQKKSS